MQAYQKIAQNHLSQELDRAHSLDLYDYGARSYDPILKTWTTQDPKLEKYYPTSPYVYCANNPIQNIDPNGKKWVNSQGKKMWENGKWTKYATRDAIRIGISMRATAIGLKTFNQVANGPSAIQIQINTSIITDDEEAVLTRGIFIPENGGRIPQGQNTIGGTIIIYEGSIKAEINNIIPSFGEVNTLIKSLPNNIAVDAVIDSVGVHEAIHTLPDNIKKNAENSRAKMEKKPEPHDLELNPTLTQIQYLKELITNIKTNKNEK